jgi:hypothetical protein
MKRVGLSFAASLFFHVALISGEYTLGSGSKSERFLDSIVSWPAWTFSQIVPPGHGVPQLVLPFLFSLLFYAGFFWLVFLGYARLRK